MHVTMTPSSHVTVTVPPVLVNSSLRSPNPLTTVWVHLVSTIQGTVHIQCNYVRVYILGACAWAYEQYIHVHVYTALCN